MQRFLIRTLAAVSLWAVWAGTTPLASARADEPGELLSITPAQRVLRGQGSRQQLLVTDFRAERPVDQTRDAVYKSETPDVVQVDERGIVTVVGDGVGSVIATADGLEARATFEVRDAAQHLPVTLERDIIPLFTSTGCNSGACHGKERGQNGFQLSLLGFYPDFDYDSLIQESRGRRIFPASPDRSLLLRKAAAIEPHGGGRRMPAGSPHYDLLRRWIASGMPRQSPDDPVLERVSIDPPERVMDNNALQQVIVTAHYTDGSMRDVTDTAQFQSSESPIVAVSDDGLIQAGPIPGDAVIMARYMGKIALCEVSIPLPGEVPSESYAGLPRHNFIDEHVWTKLERLGITPSPPADDATFLRRVFLDVIGRVPTLEETRSFLNDSSPDKRERLVEYLLEQPEFAEYWANKWSDLLLPNPYRVGIKAVLNYDAWIRGAFRQNMPYDQFVRELITAQGSTWHNGATTLFRDRRSPDEITTIVSQLFLGIRLECAKCHHHPFEKWGQEDFYSFAAYFARLGNKGTGLSPPISGGEEIIYTANRGTVKHPNTGEELDPAPLFGTAPPLDPQGDPREALAAWITSPDNPFFEQVMANRVWADLMGRGLVEPVDDLRSTNPPTNGPLLEALGESFREGGYDLKQLIRTIATSYVYGLSSLPNERNVADTRNYSRHYRKRLRAESLLDSVSIITGMPESFPAMPPQSRAMELWTRRVDSSFLDAFGRPDPNQDPPCERTSDTTVVQALHLMNSPNLHRKVTSDSGRAAQLAAGDKTPAEIVEDLYLLTYCRFPTDDELSLGVALFEKDGNRRQTTEDLLWALMNTPEFVFQN